MKKNSIEEFKKMVIDYDNMYNHYSNMNINKVNRLCIKIEREAERLVSLLDKEEIETLLNYENRYVVLFISKYALDKYPEIAKKSLRKFRFDLGLIGMNARIILKQWKRRNKK